MDDLTIERIDAGLGHLRNAALYFRELRNQYSSRLENLKTSGDLNTTVLHVVGTSEEGDPQLESLCMAQGQYAYVLKAKSIGKSVMLCVVLEKQAADMYKAIMEETKKTNGYFPSGLEKHFELQCYLLSLETLHYYGEYLLSNEEANGGNLYKVGGMIDVRLMMSFDRRTCVWRRRSSSTASTPSTATRSKLVRYWIWCARTAASTTKCTALMFLSRGEFDS